MFLRARPGLRVVPRLPVRPKGPFGTAFFLSLIGVFGPSCGPAPAPAAAQAARQGIVNGALAQRAGVGTLIWRRGGEAVTCTATLINSRTVLTAQHCVVARGQTSSPSDLYFVLTDGPPSTREDLLEVEAVHVHPGYRDNQAEDPPMGAVVLEGTELPMPISHYDAAILHLREDVVFAGVRWAETMPAVGAEVVLYGRGQTDKDEAGDGRMRRATNYVSWRHDLGFSVAGGTGDVGNLCAGDSGGPSFTGDTMVGVHSVGTCYFPLTFGGTTRMFAAGYDLATAAIAPWIRAHQAAPRLAPPEVRRVEGQVTAGRLALELEAWAAAEVDRVELWVDGAAASAWTPNDGAVRRVPDAARQGFSEIVEVPVSGPGPYGVALRVLDRLGRAAEVETEFVAPAPEPSGPSDPSGPPPATPPSDGVGPPTNEPAGRSSDRPLRRGPVVGGCQHHVPGADGAAAWSLGWAVLLWGGLARGRRGAGANRRNH